MIPYCFHPTRVVFVGNHPELINRVEDNLPKMTFEFFHSSLRALRYINEVCRPSPFYERSVVKKEKNQGEHGHLISRHIIDTHHEIYRPERFDEISTVVMKYSPPQAAFCASESVPELTAFEFFEPPVNTAITRSPS